MRGNSGVNLTYVRIAAQNRYQFFLDVYRVLDFLAAHFGFNRIRCNDEDKTIGFVDTLKNFLPPIRSKGDVFPIHPHIAIVRGKGLMKLQYKVFITSGIGNKRIWHYDYPPMGVVSTKG